MKWISVEDKLPPRYVGDWNPHTDDFIIFCLHEKQHSKSTSSFGSYDYDSKKWTNHWGDEIENVTHYIASPK